MPTSTKIVFDPAEIEKKNKAFHKMSKKRQRIAIAKDVLAQLRAKKYHAEQGTYHELDFGDKYPHEQHSIMNSIMEDFQKTLLTKKDISCNVCGLGAAFCSLARLGDQLSWKDREHEVLIPIFGHLQVGLIEAAFENDIGFMWSAANRAGKVLKKDVAADLERRINKFYHRYKDDDKRLAAIFRNIIRNDGTYKL